MTAQFELLEVLGRGGMGVAWRARDAAGLTGRTGLAKLSAVLKEQS